MKKMQQELEAVLGEVLNKLQTPNSDGWALACCPEHKNGQERHPSFSVNIDTGHYRCFACGIKGGFDDLMRLLKISPNGVVVRKVEKKVVPKNDNVNEAVLAIFRQCPNDLLTAGFEKKFLQEYEIGYDALYQRITFPIRNTTGKLVAVSGRAPDGVEPRYKVYSGIMLRGAADEHYSSESKNWLYCGNRVPKGSKHIILTEGFKACLWLRQHGFSNAVASMGTMVTDRQLNELRKLCSRVIVVFDMDDSGIRAGRKVQKKLLEKGIPTSVLSYTSKQPDELSQEQLLETLGRFTN